MNKKVLVGVLGPNGSYSEEAALKLFSGCDLRVDYLTTQSVIEDVSRLNLDYGVVPVENSIQGVVSSTLDSLLTSRVGVLGEVILPIHHVIASLPNAKRFNRVISHEQALSQCCEYLHTEYPKCVLEPVASTSHAAKKVSGESILDALVICSAYSVRTYGLKVVSSDISNGNETRFLVIGNELTMSSGDDKTMIAFGLSDKPGALYDSLKVFKDYGINLSRIESRPTKKKLGEYLFYVDFNGHMLDGCVIKALSELSGFTSFVKVLGSYPKNLNKSFNLGDINGL